jgi:hypothetical protein
MDRSDVARWVSRYEQAWRSPGTELLAELFAPEARYLVSPWAPPIEGLTAIAEMWERERQGPDERFDMHAEVVAVEGRTGVVRVAVAYHGGTPRQWRDLWILHFDDLVGSVRCREFEEWPFAPDQPDGHEPDRPSGPD